MQIMVLLALPVNLGDFVRANVGEYSIRGASGYDYETFS